MKKLIYLMIAWAVFLPIATQAHKPADSYLRLQIHDNVIDGTWDIALLDLESTAHLDAHDDLHTIKEFALQHLVMTSGNKPCAIHGIAVSGDDKQNPTISFKGECSTTITSLTIDFSPILAIDTQYRGLVFIKAGGADYTTALSAENPYFTVTLGKVDRWQQFTDYLREGVFHIWTGYDHILFLISLLLSAAFISIGGTWQPRDSFKETLWQVLKIVTAFTIAHSITLSLVMFGAISLPSRLVESTIALSIAVVAANNLRPVLHQKLWLLTFGFGLIHGMGFASALEELGLPDNDRWISLLGFNLGVEIGQVAIVIVALPVIYGVRHSPFYRQVILRTMSMLIIAVALIWFTQRAFGITLLQSVLGA